MMFALSLSAKDMIIDNRELKFNPKLKIQTDCPYTYQKIKSYHYDYKGYRLYTCCAGCLVHTENDPEGTIKLIIQKDQRPISIIEDEKRKDKIKQEQQSLDKANK
jgi:hypothetical protein